MTDLYKALGMERPTQERNIVWYCGYNLWCPKCGYKSAIWTIDGPLGGAPSPKETFERQNDEVTFPTHIDHGTITIYAQAAVKSWKELSQKLNQPKLVSKT